ncbi:hypothetical protein AZOA_02230 [Azoarcus sp. Aa7]|nr:hypothetical protein [Azoarcus sp. Aa7]
MTTTLQVQPHNYRAIRKGDRQVLLHVPTTSIFELDPAASDLLGLFEASPAVSADDIQSRFDGRYTPAELCDSLSDFIDLGIVAPQPKHYEIPARVVERSPLKTLVLTLTTGCNLGCSYCYREDLTSPKNSSVMDFQTGSRSIDLLMEEASEQNRVGIVFFGGEPLTRIAVIRDLVEYAEEKAAAVGKEIDFSLTTNATLLTDEIIAFLDAHRFGITISIDGDQAQHDRHRRTIAGGGTYKTVAMRVKRLLERYQSKPVGARVTLASGNLDVAGIYKHLHDELGFFEVGFAPATAGPDSPVGLTREELDTVFEAFKALGREYVSEAKRGKRHGFGNMQQLMTDLWMGTRKVLPCGAGVGLLAVGTSGKISLCHRFTGSELETFGDVTSGIERESLSTFMTRAQAPHSACQVCPARSLCAGGCYHESYSRSGDPFQPTFEYCDQIREWTAFGLEAFGDIALANPAFFNGAIEQRSALQ